MTGALTTYSTSTYVYFGPQAKTVNESALVYATGPNACPVGRHDISGDAAGDAFLGAVVITELWLLECTLTEFYRHASSRGASALVLVTLTPLGAHAYMRDDWDETLFVHSSTTLVQVSHLDMGTETVAAWHKHGTADSRAQVGPVHVLEFQSLCTSWVWTIAMRVLLPGFAVWTSLGAATIARRHHRFQRSAAYWICFMEAPPVFSTGLFLVTGMYGPYWLTYPWFLALNFQLSGCSIFTTLFLALVLHEKTRGLNRLPQRDVFKFYQHTIAGALVVCVGSDITFLVVSFAAKTMAIYERLIFIMVLVYFINGLIIGFIYYIVSRTMQTQLRSLVKLISLGPVEEQQVHRMNTLLSLSNLTVLVWLVLTGIAVALGALGPNVPLVAADNSAVTLFYYRFVSAFLRIVFSYTKVQIFSNAGSGAKSKMCSDLLSLFSLVKRSFKLHSEEDPRVGVGLPSDELASVSQDSTISTKNGVFDSISDRGRNFKAAKLQANLREDALMLSWDFGTLGDEEGTNTPRWLNDPTFTPRGWGYYPDARRRVFPDPDGRNPAAGSSGSVGMPCDIFVPDAPPDLRGFKKARAEEREKAASTQQQRLPQGDALPPLLQEAPVLTAAEESADGIEQPNEVAIDHRGESSAGERMQLRSFTAGPLTPVTVPPLALPSFGATPSRVLKAHLSL
jgi:hypothetical protein